MFQTIDPTTGSSNRLKSQLTVRTLTGLMDSERNIRFMNSLNLTTDMLIHEYQPTEPRIRS
jgi:hypothetical protein